MSSVVLRGLVKKYGDAAALRGLDLEIHSGEFAVLVGPSGCGKSTLLRVVAGLEDATEGGVFIGGRDMRGVPPQRRKAAMVFQSYALFPHLSAAANIGYGLKIRGTPPAEAERRILETARMLDVREILGRRPGELSGGQRQRVAMARAMIRDPDLFLFDEPLSNLDALLRAQVRVELKRIHRRIGKTMIYVTHDQIEAMTLADKVVVLNRGRIEQVGEPLEIYDRPANAFVAEFIGPQQTSFVDVDASGGGVRMVGEPAPDLRVADDDGGGDAGLAEILAALAARRGGGVRLVMGVRPEAVVVDEKRGVPMGVDIIERTGPLTYFHVSRGKLSLCAAVQDRLPEDRSAALRVSLRRRGLLFFDAETRARMEVI